MPDEIDLNEEEEAALERAWKKLDAEREKKPKKAGDARELEQNAKKSDVSQRGKK